MFVYNYFTDHLLGLAQKDLPIALTKRILKDTLRGLAALHDRNFVHTGKLRLLLASALADSHQDVKANNILIEWEESNDGMVIQQVQLADLEDGACVPPGTAIVGKQAGNEMWRSPEAHARGPMSTPSDIFSFGIVVSIHARSPSQLSRKKLPLFSIPLIILSCNSVSMPSSNESSSPSTTRS